MQPSQKTSTNCKDLEYYGVIQWRFALGTSLIEVIVTLPFSLFVPHSKSLQPLATGRKNRSHAFASPGHIGPNMSNLTITRVWDASQAERARLAPIQGTTFRRLQDVQDV